MTNMKKVESEDHPVLDWSGKHFPLKAELLATRLIETFCPHHDEVEQNGYIWDNWPKHYPRGGLLFYGDSKDILNHLLSSGFCGRVDLIYIDPPFDSNVSYTRNIIPHGTEAKKYLERPIKQVLYAHNWHISTYLQYIYERLLIAKEILSDSGIIFVRMGSGLGHYVQVILDEVFGIAQFQNAFFVNCKKKKQIKKETRTIPQAVEYLYVYFKSKEAKYAHISDEMLNMNSNWTDIPGYSQRTGYLTENSEDLLERVILIGTKPGDLVMDFFSGSGTTVTVAQKLGRRWIGCDINRCAIQTISNRLHMVIREQINQRSFASLEASIHPAQLCFYVYRITDYDLPIPQHQALELACQHLNIQRNDTNGFFHGLGRKKLVRFVSFNHPLAISDLEEIKYELKIHSDDKRDIVVVCLEKGNTDGWLADWNGHKKPGNINNKIEIMELHQFPAIRRLLPDQVRANVTTKHSEGKLKVVVNDFSSPSIEDLLAKHQNLDNSFQGNDWRPLVGSVMIDPYYDGEVFNAVLSDIPESRSALVKGVYELDIPKRKDIAITVAVKITDILGSEVIITNEL